MRFIVETGCVNPAINTTFFPNTPSWTWSSTPLDQTNSPAYAWVANFDNGYTYANVKAGSLYVRLVRSGQLVDTFDRQANYAPTAFTLTAQTGVTTGTVVESNTITLAGLTTVTGIKVGGGQYKIGGGSYTSAPGVVGNGDTITVKLTSSASAATQTAATLTVGGVAGDFQVTTAGAADTTPDQFSFTDQTNVALSTPTESNAITVAGIDSAAAELGIALDNGVAILSVRQGYVILPGLTRTRSATETRRAASAEFSEYRIHAGERVTLDATGRIESHVLGNETGDGAGDPLTLNLPANLNLAVTVPKLGAVAERLGTRVDAALATAAGMKLIGGQSSSGILSLDYAGQGFKVLPLGTADIDAEQADGVKLGADGTATITASGVSVRFAPAVLDLGGLARDLAAALPGATLTIDADGVLAARHEGTTYVVRPDWFSHIDTTRAAGFATMDDGRLGYVRNFRAYTLNPAFADFAKLQAAVQQALPDATATTHPDGTMQGFAVE